MLEIASLQEMRKNVLDKEGWFLLDFWGPNCPPCLVLNKALPSLEQDFAGRLTVVKVNAEEQVDLATEWGVRGLPTLFLLHNGNVVEHWVGAVSASKLRARIDKALK